MKVSDINLTPTINGDKENIKNKANDSFADILKQSLNEVNELQNKADDSIKGIASGKMDNIQDAVMAIEKADISLKLVTEIRNKAVEAYKEVMRMQV